MDKVVTSHLNSLILWAEQLDCFSSEILENDLFFGGKIEVVQSSGPKLTCMIVDIQCMRSGSWKNVSCKISSTSELMVLSLLFILGTLFFNSEVVQF
uniref:Uncharacterized protein n=1 Tax=Oryza glumipatula TaxID=40148 RepID=A0A0D9YW55_9ORYZ